MNLGQALNASNRHPEAVGYLRQRLAYPSEDCGDALFNLALTSLFGEFELGWQLYECRFKTVSMMFMLGFKW